MNSKVGNIEIAGPTHEAHEAAVRREQVKPEAARQHKQRRGKKAGGDVHNVDRTVAASRVQEAAEATMVERGPIKRWQRAYALPHLPDPPGYVLQYVGRHGQHRGDEARLTAALQEGWEFARKSDFPKHFLPTQTLPGFGQIIGNDSTVLMKLPVEFKQQMDAYYNGKRDSATRAVTRRHPGLPEATKEMPLVEDRNDVSADNPRMRARRAPRQEAQA